MKAKNTSINELQKALETINKKYDGNITFKRLDNGKTITFTLTVKSSREKGARRGHQGQRVSAACWHAHGDFFDSLFSINPDAVIVSMGTRTITKQDGNWQDRNIGSQMQPLYYSEACDCHE